MTNINIEFFGRPFDLEIIYDCDENDCITTKQVVALSEFLTNTNYDNTKLNQLIKYCEENSNGLLKEEITNIFKYVIPEILYIPLNQEILQVVIMCKFRFDIEHGLAIQIQNNEIISIKQQSDLY